MKNKICRQNVALLIDADNASPDSVAPALSALAELGPVNIRRAYGNWSKPSMKGWAAATLKHGIEPYQQFDVIKGKNSTDIRMTIDAMDLLHSGRVGGFGILSSDSDFMPLALRIRQEGLKCYGFGTERTPDGFRKACDRFITVQQRRKLPNVSEPGAHPGDDAGNASKNGKMVLDKRLLTLLNIAYDAVKCDAKDEVSLSSMGQHLSRNDGGFDCRKYGYARLSQLVAAAQGFQATPRDGGHIFIKRVK